MTWISPEASEIIRHLATENERTLDSYRIQPRYVREHVQIERSTAQGGYENRQLYELIQNGADALQTLDGGGRIEVVLTSDRLYCANQGEPLTVGGLETILGSHMSTKRGTEIGRFGLGFKSVLAVTDRPRFHSRSGSFEFDKMRSINAVRDAVGNLADAPTLRLAWPIDTTAAATRDSVLAELVEWASTVVELPLTCDPVTLSRDLAEFPAEFLLFSPHVADVRLRDDVGKTTRSLITAVDGEHVVLTDGRDTSRWKVFSTVVQPSEDARQGSGDRTDRDVLPLTWAVPVGGTPGPGAFWAFFPTEYQSTLRGILNSPWKTTADRQNLQHALINEELLEAAAQLVVSRLSDLSSADDPAAHLDAMPGRLRDAKQWADEMLNQRIYELASNRAVVPDWSGRLSKPQDVALLPDLLTETETALIGEGGLTTRFSHPSVLRRTRHARARRLCADTELELSDVLETTAKINEAGAAAAIRLLLAVRERLSPREHRHLAERTQVVPDQDGELHAAIPGEVYLPHSAHMDLGLPVVAPGVLAKAGVREALETLGVTPPSDGAAIRACLNMDVTDWDQVWRLIDNLDDDQRNRLLGSLDPAEIRVRTREGTWQPADTVLLPSATEDRTDPRFTLDTARHGSVANAIAALGISDRVMQRRVSESDPYLRSFCEECRAAFQRSRGGRPQMGYLQFQPNRDVAGPVRPLIEGSDELRLRMTKEFLEFCRLPGWRMTHVTRTDVYGHDTYGPPELWLVKRYGLLDTSLGPTPVADCVAPTLERYRSFLPVAQVSEETAELLGLPTNPENLHQELVGELLVAAQEERCDAALIPLVYECAALAGAPRPKTLWSNGRHEPSELVVVCSDGLIAEHLTASGVPVLETPTRTADALVESWGLRSVGDVADETIEARDPTTPEPVADLYEALRDRLPDPSLTLSRCAAIVRRVTTEAGRVEETVRVRLDGRSVLAVDDASDEEIVTYLNSHLTIGLRQDELRTVIEPVVDRRRDELLDRINRLPTLPLKLAEALGPHQLRRSLSEDVIQAVFPEEQPSDEYLAQVLIATHGTHVLRHLADELRVAGLEPPRRWKGSAKAESFVRSLGFPIEFAGSEERHRPEVERVPGSVQLPPLHDYQEEVVSSLEEVLRSDDGRRVLVSLPTGSGKTRVMVESLIREIGNRTDAQVVWIAQRDELCEQAVQAWTELWRATGPEDLELSIGRLWGGRRVLPLERPSVVVTTYQTLRNRIGRSDHGWLTEPDWVVIDEAHGATTASYTRIRAELGLGGRERARPLIGLTATPFRGTSERETADLARLFGRNLIDPFDGRGLTILQDRRVLAVADHVLLEGSDIQLSREEEAHLERFSSLPDTVEDRLGRDGERNERILQSVLSLPDEWPVLLFASSVHQAEVLAAKLTIAGAPAQAISGSTDRDARRFAIDEFDRGGIRALTNYAVLHQGFDAPKVRAVYICRPTFSPATYQQMIGRGLRGPLNGGSERCLIVDVADNIARFGGRLAFRSFGHLWNR